MPGKTFPLLALIEDLGSPECILCSTNETSSRSASSALTRLNAAMMRLGTARPVSEAIIRLVIQSEVVDAVGVAAACQPEKKKGNRLAWARSGPLPGL